MLCGFGASANIGCGFGVDMRSGFVAVFGSMRHTYVGVGSVSNVLGTTTNVEPSQANCLAGYEALGSVHYTQEIGCFCIRGEVGYRIDYYFGLAGQTNFTNSVEPTEEVNRGYGSPFIGASVWY